MTTNTDHRQAAEASLQLLIATLQRQPQGAATGAIVAECEALKVAIRAFHMEGIRFRMFNVDRLLNRSGSAVTDEAKSAFADVRHQLEAAGFHTRSHQAPT